MKGPGEAKGMVSRGVRVTAFLVTGGGETGEGEAGKAGVWEQEEEWASAGFSFLCEVEGGGEWFRSFGASRGEGIIRNRCHRRTGGKV